MGDNGTEFAAVLSNMLKATVEDILENASLSVNSSQNFPDHGTASYLAEAWAFYKSGDFKHANLACQTILAINPGQFDALYLSGLIAAQTGNPSLAKACYLRAIAINACVASVYLNLGLALSNLTELEAAVTSLKQAVELEPNNVNGHLNLGDVFRQLKQFDQAILCYDKAIHLKPAAVDIVFKRAATLHILRRYAEALADYTQVIAVRNDMVEAHFNRAAIYRTLKQQELALCDYDRVIELKPALRDAHINRGNILKDLKRFDEALMSYDVVISREPSNEDLYCQRAHILVHLERISEAVQAYDTAIQLNPNNFKTRNDRGALLLQLGHVQEAADDFTQAIALKKDYANAYCNRGIANLQLADITSGFSDLEKSISLNPENAVAYYNYGNALREKGFIEDALESFEKAIFHKPGYEIAHLNAGLCALSLKKFDSGWSHYEWRLKCKKFSEQGLLGHSEVPFEPSGFHQREDFLNRTIFIASEQGVGDYIMFLSILPDLCQDAGKVICQLDHRLISIFSRCFPDVIFVRTGDVSVLDRIKVDHYIRMGSLGYTYRQDMNDFSGSPYLSPDPARVAHWQARLNSRPNKLQVGISWRGGSEKTNGKVRSLALQQLDPLLSRNDCEFVSLQHGDVETEVTTYNKQHGRNITCFPKSETTDFEDLAALISRLDCVVSVQNTTVHVCGALGKPCFTLLPLIPEWRFGLSGSKMPWHSSVVLHRQSQGGQWSSVIDAVTSEINAFEQKR